MKTLTKLLIGVAFVTSIGTISGGAQELKKGQPVMNALKMVGYSTLGTGAGIGILYHAKKYEDYNPKEKKE